ncbi:MAG: FHA domain-containing protein [bacterium]
MMPTFMSYRIVILNGEKRGDRLEIGRVPLTIGKGASCDIQLPDPQAGEIHARITSRPTGLQITAAGALPPLLVNKTSVHESELKHGDVIEIGSTRLFVQSQRGAETWDPFARLRQWRKWITIGLPVLLITSIALTLNQCRHQSEALPAPNPAPRRTHTPAATDTNNTDWTVTNVARIVINPAVSLTSTPPEIAEARELFIETRTNNIDQEIEAARQILDFATEYLAEARKLNAQTQAIPETPLPAILLEEAKVSMGLIPPPTDPSLSTNAPSNTASNDATPIQADSLKH